MKPMNVLGVASSMRESSYGTRTLRIVLNTAQKYEAKTRLLDLRRVIMPMYNPDSSMQSNKEIQKVTNDVNWADAFVLV